MIYLGDFAPDTLSRLSLGCVNSCSQSSLANQARPQRGLITLKGEDNEISSQDTILPFQGAPLKAAREMKKKS